MVSESAARHLHRVGLAALVMAVLASAPLGAPPAAARPDCEHSPEAKGCGAGNPHKPRRPPLGWRNLNLVADWLMPTRGDGPERNPASTDPSQWSAYTSPARWLVKLNACRSYLGTPEWPNDVDKIARYDWTIVGVGQIKATSCTADAWVPSLGDYQVRLVATTSFGTSKSTETVISPRDRLVVSLGDSAASGEGVPNAGHILNAADWDMRQCHRSWNAAPKRAAQRLHEPKVSTTFVPLGCSGAGISTGLLRGYRGIVSGPMLLPQVAAAAAYTQGRRIDSLIISAGINDLGFSQIAETCVKRVKCWGTTANKGLPRKLATLPALYDQLHREIERQFRGRLPRQVVLTGYPDPTKGDGSRYKLKRTAQGAHCQSMLDIGGQAKLQFTHSEVLWADKEILRPLNKIISEAASARAAQGWRTVQPYPAFTHHGYCAGKDNRAFIRLSESMGRQPEPWKGVWKTPFTIDGSLHPNNKGQAMIADLLEPALRTTPALDRLTNSGFELGTRGWTAWPGVNWVVYRNGQVAPGRDAHSGEHYLSTNSRDGSGGYQDVDLHFAPGETVCARARVRSENVPGAGVAFALWMLGGAINDNGVSQLRHLSTDWTEAATCVTATQYHTKLRVEFYPVPGTPTVSVDDVELFQSLSR